MSEIIRELSVFFPAYNEAKNIENTVLSAKKVLKRVAETWEILVINDGSEDKTAEIVESLGREDTRIKVISHKINKGYGATLKTGFKKAKYEWVAFADSDGQFNFSEITKFLEKKDEADLILGFRKKRADSLLRKIFTWGWNLFPKIILGMKAKDYSCGFKMIKKKVFEDIQPLVGEEKVTQIELLVKAQRMGFKFAEVGVSHYPRKAGHATGANIKVVIRSIFDLMNLWGKLK